MLRVFASVRKRDLTCSQAKSTDVLKRQRGEEREQEKKEKWEKQNKQEKKDRKGKNGFWKEEDQTVVPGTTVRFILHIARVYSEAPGKCGDQAA